MCASSALECGAFLLGVRASDIVGLGGHRERHMLMIDHHPPRAAVTRTCS